MSFKARKWMPKYELTMVSAFLESIGACSDAIEWVNERPFPELWETCHRGDWMLWFAARVGVAAHFILPAAIDCVMPRLILPVKFAPRVLPAIITPMEWLLGNANASDLLNAYADADKVASKEEIYSHRYYTAEAASAIASYAHMIAVGAAHWKAADAINNAARSYPSSHSVDLQNSKHVRNRIAWSRVLSAIEDNIEIT